MAHPDLFDWQPPATYPEAPGFKERGGTSEEAAAAIESHAHTLRGRVWRLFDAGQELTADEIAALLNETVLAVRPRVSELRKSGRIEPTGERRENASGMRAWVWRAA